MRNPTSFATSRRLIFGAILLTTFASKSFGGGQSFIAAGSNNLRQISHASFIYAQNHQDRYPEATDVWDYARLLAIDGDLDNAKIWQLPIDPANKETAPKKSTILLPGKLGQPRELNPGFRELKPSIAVAIGPRMNTNRSSTTPIAWSRGLQPDGTWAAHSPYGSRGGLILFLGGNVEFFKALTNAEGGELIRPDGHRTSNILEALPPGTRISEYIPTLAEQEAWAKADRTAPRTPTHYNSHDQLILILLPFIWAPFISLSIYRLVKRKPNAVTVLFWPIFLTLLVTILMPTIGYVE